MNHPHHQHSETELLARAKQEAIDRISRSVRDLGGDVVDGGVSFRSLVRQHPLLAGSASFAVGLVGAAIATRMLQAAPAAPAQPVIPPPPPEKAGAASSAGRHFLWRSLGEALVRLVIERSASAATRPAATAAADPGTAGAQSP